MSLVVDLGTFAKIGDGICDSIAKPLRVQGNPVSPASTIQNPAIDDPKLLPPISILLSYALMAL
jgi:hypothetical protein